MLESVDFYFRKYDKIKESLRYIEDLGVDRFIVTSPLLMDIICDVTNLPIKISTIVSPRYINSLEYYKEMGADMVCIDIYKNRHFDFLRDYNYESLQKGITIELLTNEFCMYGNAPCADIMRTPCYTHSALGGNMSQYFSNWPFGKCQKKRKEQPICWLKAPFVLPQHLSIYKELTGINHFKLSGRTNSSEFWEKTVKSYFEQDFQGNLLNLYEEPQKTKTVSDFNPSIQELNDVGFFDIWFKDKKSCDYRCGKYCNWCELKFMELIK
jgi:hypothetical protein